MASMSVFGMHAVLVIGLVACGRSGPPPRQPEARPERSEAVSAPPVQPEAGLAPLEQPEAVSAPTCLEVAVRFGEWIHLAFRGAEPIPQQEVVDKFRRICIGDQWTVEERQCMGSAETHDDWNRCFSTMSNPPPPVPPPVPPPPAKPELVPPTVLENNRTSGDGNIMPDDPTMIKIQKSGKKKVVGTFKLCLDTQGAVLSVTPIKSTGFTAYDDKIQREMKQWVYRPYLVNSIPVPVCSVRAFIYAP